MSIKGMAKAVLPAKTQRWLLEKQRRYRLQWPRTGSVNFAGLRRLKPVSRIFGLDRGLPIDRYYIEQFLSDHASDIRGRVLEMGDDFYTQKFGGDRVIKSDVLHCVDGNPTATIVADLTRGDNIPSDAFDCIIFTQTLQMIYDTRPALRHLFRILRPGGTLLATASGISKVARREGIDDWGEYWHFTSQSMHKLFQETFPSATIQIETYGNVLAAIAYLHGLATEDLLQEELDYSDGDYEVLITVRAVKQPSDTREYP